MNLDDLISIVPIQEADSRTDKLSRAIMEGGEDGRTKTAGGLKKHLNDTYGIDLVDVRLRRLSYPPQVAKPFSIGFAASATRKWPTIKARRRTG